MSSDAIEGEPSHLEATHIVSPSMPILNVLSALIFQPILTPMIPLMIFLLSLMMTLEIHKDNQSIGIIKDLKDDQQIQRQWLECMKNSYAIAKE
jgi:hypothetical protein